CIIKKKNIDQTSVATYIYGMKHEKYNTPTGLAAEIGMSRPFRHAEEEAFLNLVRTYFQLSSRGEKLFKEHGISGPQYNVLRILRGHGTPVSVYQIAAEMVTPSSDMPRLVDRLEAAELITKTRCENDRRVVWVNLTKQGKALLKKLDGPLTELHQSQLGHMSEQDLKTLSNLLYRARHPDSNTIRKVTS
ncbi:MAG: MarR family transcriptional regulator, partial [Planctomycetaceae bacterium]|nr:MarR family transcriptional regulator [Planctomycetaceae bacterium]